MKKGFLKTFFKDAIRGLVKSVPLGNTAISIVDNIKHERETSAEINPDTKPHSYTSILFQVVGISAIIYCLVTKTITIDECLNLIGFKK